MVLSTSGTYSEVVCFVSPCVGSVVVFVVVMVFLLACAVCVVASLLALSGGGGDSAGLLVDGLRMRLALARRPGRRISGFLIPWVLSPSAFLFWFLSPILGPWPFLPFPYSRVWFCEVRKKGFVSSTLRIINLYWNSTLTPPWMPSAP